MLIVHIGTNNVCSDTPKQVTEKLIQLHRHVKSIAPETKLVLSNIIRRHDYQNLGKKIIEINSLLAIECKCNKIDLIDNINVTGTGRKGLHPNNLGKEQIAGNLLGIYYGAYLIIFIFILTDIIVSLLKQNPAGSVHRNLKIFLSVRSQITPLLQRTCSILE